MSIYIQVVNNVPTLGVQAYDIHTVVRDVQAELLVNAPRGARCATIYSLLSRQEDRYHLATIQLQNMRGNLISTALVWSEKPMVPRQQFHANHKAPIQCRTCGSLLFYNVGRSLFYENHLCADCGHPAQTLTETGAST